MPILGYVHEIMGKFNAIDLADGVQTLLWLQEALEACDDATIEMPRRAEIVGKICAAQNVQPDPALPETPPSANPEYMRWMLIYCINVLSGNNAHIEKSLTYWDTARAIGTWRLRTRPAEE